MKLIKIKEKFKKIIISYRIVKMRNGESFIQFIFSPRLLKLEYRFPFIGSKNFIEVELLKLDCLRHIFEDNARYLYERFGMVSPNKK